MWLQNRNIESKPSRVCPENREHRGGVEPKGLRSSFALYVNIISRTTSSLVFALIYVLNTQVHIRKSIPKGGCERVRSPHIKGEQIVEDRARVNQATLSSVKHHLLWSRCYFPLSHKFIMMQVIYQRGKKVRFISGDSFPVQCVSVWCFYQYVLNRHKKLWTTQNERAGCHTNTRTLGVTTLWNWPHRGGRFPPDPLWASSAAASPRSGTFCQMLPTFVIKMFWQKHHL